MSITKVLSDKDIAAAEKLAAVAETVAKARDAYGNSDAEIEAPFVNSAYGSVSFADLEDDAKVEVLKGRAMEMKVSAAEYGRQVPGANVNKKVEELLATDAYFANVAAGTKFEYL